MRRILLLLLVLLALQTSGTNAAGSKRIDVDLSEQRLRYYDEALGERGSFLISSGAIGYKTPTGRFTIQRKAPSMWYRGIMRGRYYSYPGTKWNLQFAPHYYIHGAYWHNQFGTRRSRGCINVSYANMEALYVWADVGTIVTIHQ